MIEANFALGKAAEERTYLLVFASSANAAQHKISHNPIGRSIFCSSAVLSRNDDATASPFSRRLADTAKYAASLFMLFTERCTRARKTKDNGA